MRHFSIVSLETMVLVLQSLLVGSKAGQLKSDSDSKMNDLEIRNEMKREEPQPCLP
jgi:hypothetical protein